MKILHIIDSGGLYGAEMMLLNLVAEQVKAGLQPLIASVGDLVVKEKSLEVEARKRNLPVKTFRFRPGLNIRGAFQLLNFAKNENFQLLHSHGYKGNIFFGLMPRTIRKLPIVSTLHGWTSTSGPTKMCVYEWLDAFSLKFVDRVVFVNRSMENHPRLKMFPENHKKIIYNGIGSFDQPETLPLITSDAVLEFVRQRFTIVGIGRFSPEKGFLSLLHATADLIADGLDLQLLLLGDGGLRTELSKQAKSRGIGARIYMPGHVENVSLYLKECQLFAMPSLTEGLPIALLEAMLAEVPVVASRVGGIPDALLDGQAGCLIAPDNIEELKKAIKSVYFAPESLALEVRLAKDLVRTKFSSLKMAESYSRVYSQVLIENQSS